MDVYVAQLQIAQAQAARIEVGIEFGDDAQLANGAIGGVVEADVERQRRIGRQIGIARSIQHHLRAADADNRAGGDALLRRLLQVLGQAQGLRSNRTELRVQHTNVAQVFLLCGTAGEHAEVKEMRVLHGMAVVGGSVRQFRHRAIHGAVVGAALLKIIDGCLGRRGVTGVTRGVAIPLLHLVEKAQQVGLGPIAVAALAQQDAGGQRRVQTHHLRVPADRRRLIERTQQAGRLERTKPALGPLRPVRGQYRQTGRCRGVGENRGAQLVGVGDLLRDEFVARQGRCRARHVEAERHRQRLELGDVLVRFGGQELGSQTRRNIVQAAHAGIQNALRLPVRAHRVELVAQAVEVVCQPLRQPGIGLQVERHANKAARRDVERVAGREVVASGVLGAIQFGPRHVLAAGAVGGCHPVALGIAGIAVALERASVRLAADVAAENDIRQSQALQQIFAVAHVGGTEIEAHIRRIDIGKALQRNAVGGTITRIEVAVSADADGDIGLDAAIDQVAVGLGDVLSVGIGDAHVIQAERCLMQVEHGPDMRRVDHLPARGLQLGHRRAVQLHQRTGAEMRTVDVEGDPAMLAVAGTAGVRCHACDRQRQQIRADHNRRAGGTLARLDQHVIVPRQSAGHQHLLIRSQRIGVGGIKGVSGGNLAVAHIHLVGPGGRAGVKRDTQGLAGRDADLVQACLARRKSGGQRRRDGQTLHPDFDTAAGRGAVVGFAGRQVEPAGGVADLAFEYLVVEVGAHDDAPVAVFQRR